MKILLKFILVSLTPVLLFYSNTTKGMNDTGSTPAPTDKITITNTKPAKVGSATVCIVKLECIGDSCIFRLKLALKDASLNSGWVGNDSSSYTLTAPPPVEKRTFLPHGFIEMENGDKVEFDLVDAKFYGNIDFSQPEMKLELKNVSKIVRIVFLMRGSEDKASYNLEKRIWE